MSRVLTILLVFWRALIGALNALGWAMKWSFRLLVLVGLGFATYYMGRYLLTM